MQNKHWIFIQTILLFSVLFWPFKIELSLPVIVKNTGVIFFVGGFILAVVAVKTLKDNLRPSPKPKVGGKLIRTGLYSIVRHPIYGGIIILTFGLSLWIGDGVRLLLSTCLLVFFDAKSKMEEKWLEKAYPAYANYKKQVTKRFIPWVF